MYMFIYTFIYMKDMFIDNVYNLARQKKIAFMEQKNAKTHPHKKKMSIMKI